MLVANIKIWKSHLNIGEGTDYVYGYGGVTRGINLSLGVWSKCLSIMGP